jgi:5-(aminomethyl)-3-furanmethanol phosphate kinase
MKTSLLVAKVGGSLYDLPDLAVRLDDWLAQVESRRTLLIPGGGPTADAVRKLDRTHRLGEETSHWLALRALSLNAQFLAQLLPHAPVLSRLPDPSDAARQFILDPLPFFQEDEWHPERFPHLWMVTSDSLAVRVAMRASADALVLLKSVSWPTGYGWDRATEEGVVDAFFAEALRRAPELSVRIVNLRPGSINGDFE